MDRTRLLSRNDYLLIKTATRRLIKRAGGLVKAAEITRLTKTRLSDCQNPASLGDFLPVDVVADLESYVGEAIVSQILAEFAIDAVEPHRPIDRLHRMQEVIKESAEAAIALGNGDSAEALKEIEELIEVAEKARRDIVARQSRPTIVKTVAAE